MNNEEKKRKVMVPAYAVSALLKNAPERYLFNLRYRLKKVIGYETLIDMITIELGNRSMERREETSFTSFFETEWERWRRILNKKIPPRGEKVQDD